MSRGGRSVKRYDVRHETRYRYAQNVSLSQHQLHLTPRATQGQLVETTTVSIEPEAATWREATDYFGNITTLASVDEEHLETVILAKSRVTVQPVLAPMPGDTPAWEDIVSAVDQGLSPEALFVRQFRYPSPRVPVFPDVLAMGQRFFSNDRPILEAAMDLMAHTHANFAYDGEATDVDTPVADVLRLKRGVCQDFAHVQIACLRALGLPARYVSGYLLTHPPEGQERLQGADASHAWLSVWIGKAGWIDLDPTNNLIVGDEHVTVAWGRDYGDVSPINGVTFGGGEHKIDVAVDVIPLSGT